ncbi:NAD-dependent epimerase/dehydratase family protein [Nanoarchaeota archaeon]
MKVLIIGGTGFLGQYLVNRLKKHKITAASRRGLVNPIFPIDKFATIHKGVDITKSETLRPLIKKADIVINLAACLSFRRRDKDLLLAINNQGVLNILKLCEENNVKKFIHISSIAAFGYNDQIIDETHEYDWCKEKNCVYSYSKSLPDNQVLSSTCNTTIVYPGLILGPGDPVNTKKMITAIKDQKIPLMPPGETSVIDVRDLVEAIALLLDSKVCNQKFLVSGQNIKYAELLSTIAKVTKSKPPSIVMSRFLMYPLLFFARILETVKKDPPLTYENIYTSFHTRRFNMDKICKLGFKPGFPLERTIHDSWRWIQNEK